MRIIINNTIYDITTFVNEHPGGPEVFRTQATRSATGGGGGGGGVLIFFFKKKNIQKKTPKI